MSGDNERNVKKIVHLRVDFTVIQNDCTTPCTTFHITVVNLILVSVIWKTVVMHFVLHFWNTITSTVDSRLPLWPFEVPWIRILHLKHFLFSPSDVSVTSWVEFLCRFFGTTTQLTHFNSTHRTHNITLNYTIKLHAWHFSNLFPPDYSSWTWINVAKGGVDGFVLQYFICVNCNCCQSVVFVSRCGMRRKRG